MVGGWPLEHCVEGGRLKRMRKNVESGWNVKAPSGKI